MDEWENLPTTEQNKYLQQADWLIQYGYVRETDYEKLAIEIFRKRRVKKL